jgi:hypothetical protein
MRNLLVCETVINYLIHSNLILVIEVKLRSCYMKEIDMTNNLGYENLKELDEVEIIIVVDNEVDPLSSSNASIGSITSKLLPCMFKVNFIKINMLISFIYYSRN